MSDQLFATRRSAYTGALNFDGPLTPGDATRLAPKMQAVFDSLTCGLWMTLPEIAESAGVSLLSVGSRVRDLRKPKFGGHTIESRTTDREGLHEYRLVK